MEGASAAAALALGVPAALTELSLGNGDSAPLPGAGSLLLDRVPRASTQASDLVPVSAVGPPAGMLGVDGSLMRLLAMALGGSDPLGGGDGPCAWEVLEEALVSVGAQPQGNVPAAGPTGALAAGAQLQRAALGATPLAERALMWHQVRACAVEVVHSLLTEAPTLNAITRPDPAPSAGPDPAPSARPDGSGALVVPVAPARSAGSGSGGGAAKPGAHGASQVPHAVAIAVLALLVRFGLQPARLRRFMPQHWLRSRAAALRAILADTAKGAVVAGQHGYPNKSGRLLSGVESKEGRHAWELWQPAAAMPGGVSAAERRAAARAAMEPLAGSQEVLLSLRQGAGAAAMQLADTRAAQEAVAGDVPSALAATTPARRLAAAGSLSAALGQSLELCVKALELNQDSPDRAAEWLFSGEAQRFQEAGGAQAPGAAADGSASVGQPGTAATGGGDAPGGKGAAAAQDVLTNGEADPRWPVAEQLSLVVGQPPMLCYRALELFEDQVDAATTWLLDSGGSWRASEGISDHPERAGGFPAQVRREQAAAEAAEPTAAADPVARLIADLPDDPDIAYALAESMNLDGNAARQAVAERMAARAGGGGAASPGGGRGGGRPAAVRDQLPAALDSASVLEVVDGGAASRRRRRRDRQREGGDRPRGRADLMRLQRQLTELQRGGTSPEQLQRLMMRLRESLAAGRAPESVADLLEEEQEAEPEAEPAAEAAAAASNAGRRGGGPAEPASSAQSGPEVMLDRIQSGGGGAPGTHVAHGTLLAISRRVGPCASAGEAAQAVGTMVGGSARANTASLRVLAGGSGVAVELPPTSLDDLRSVEAVFGQAVTSVDTILALASHAEASMGVLAARRAVLALLFAWPASVTLDPEVVGGAANLVLLTRLVAAGEGAFEGAIDSQSDDALAAASGTLGGAAGGHAAWSSSPLLLVVGQTLRRILCLEAKEHLAAYGRRGALVRGARKERLAVDVRRLLQPDTARSVVEFLDAKAAGPQPTRRLEDDPVLVRRASPTQPPRKAPARHSPPRLERSLSGEAPQSPRKRGSLLGGVLKGMTRVLGMGPPTKAQRARALQGEAAQAPSTLTALQGGLGAGPVVGVGEEEDGEPPLTTVLAEDCAWNVVSSARMQPGGSGGVVRESLHPYFHASRYSGAATVPGAHALVVVFDERCQLSERTTLTFYSKSGGRGKARSIGGPTSIASSSWLPLVVSGTDTVHFSFQARMPAARSAAEAWGYHFTVAPLAGLQWLRERQVLQQPSLEWGAWLLQFLASAGLDTPDATLDAGGPPTGPGPAAAPVATAAGASAAGEQAPGGTPSRPPASAGPRTAASSATSQLLAVARGAIRSPAIVLALVNYLQAPARPFKARVVALLLQLLREPHRLVEAGASPDFAPFRQLEGAVEERCREMQERESTFLPRSLQALVELCVAARRAEAICQRIVRLRADVQAAKAQGTAQSDQGLAQQHELGGLLRGRIAFDPATEFVGGGLMTRARLLVPVRRVNAAHESSLTLMDAIVHTAELSESLALSTRLPDWVVCLCAAVVNVGGVRDAEQLSTAWLEDVLRHNADFTPAMDAELVRLAVASAGAIDGDVSPQSMPPSRLELGYQAQDRYPLIANLDRSALHTRFMVLQLFNRRLQRCIEFIDTSNTEFEWSLGYRLRTIGHCIFPDTKSKLVDACVQGSWLAAGTHPMRIQLDNGRAFQTRDAGIVDATLSGCIFVQAYQQLMRHQARHFRQRLDQRERLFEVAFRGEDGMDWGGLYRDALTRMAEDAFGPHFDLFLVSPNGRRNSGQNVDKYLPNPKHSTLAVLPMFEFVGRLMGVSMRQRMSLPFFLPPYVWKQLVGQRLTLQDLVEVDETTARRIRRVQALAATTREQFERECVAETFTVTTFDGSVVELVPNGAGTLVSWDERLQFVALATEYKLHELDEQIAQIRTGLAGVIPERAIKMCTWFELEIYVCGDPRIDVDTLRRHTQYDGYHDRDRFMTRFWNVLASLTDEERGKFVRFASGRSRLPRGRWSKPFKITRRGGGDGSMPIGHTCFFQVELPAYSSEAVMRQRIMAAINYGLDGFLIA